MHLQVLCQVCVLLGFFCIFYKIYFQILFFSCPNNSNNIWGKTEAEV